MEEGTLPRQQMSLVPYTHDSREVVLRRGNAIVLLDPSSRQLSVGEAGDNALDLTECPYCHRPWVDEADSPSEFEPENEHRGRSYGRDHAFVDPDYFGMLAASQQPSPDGSRSSTPADFTRRLFVPALRSGRSRDISGTSQPPSNAEFITSEPVTAGGEGISSSAFSPGFFKQFFVEQGELGRGGNGVVLLVEHIMDRVSLGQFACKRVPVGNDHSWLEKVLVEVKLLQKIPHKNLVSYHWVWLEDHQPTKFGPSIPCLWILQEYCNGGDLHNYVLGPKQPSNSKESLKQRLRKASRSEPERPTVTASSRLAFDDIVSFFRDITTGLHHLHTKGYIHRDLKPQNCLIQRDGNKVRVLISDFGEVQAAGATRGSTGATGTISYCAPEVLRRDGLEGAFGDFTTKSDIFSLGMIVYFMCFGHLPYSKYDDINEENEDVEELREEITRWPGFNDGTRLRPDLPEQLYRFLRRLLSVNPLERPSTDEILNSIKGGVTWADSSPSFPDDGFRPAPILRKNSVTVSRPGLSSVGRSRSGETARPISPAKPQRNASQSLSRPTSPRNTSFLIQRQRKTEPNSKAEDPPTPPRTPLMLPPPRTTSSRIWSFFQRPDTIAVLRCLLFFVKILTLVLPCSPYAANGWLLYPLLALATFDVGVLPLDIRRSSIMFAVHVTFVVVANQHNRLCEGSLMRWDTV